MIISNLCGRKARYINFDCEIVYVYINSLNFVILGLLGLDRKVFEVGMRDVEVID